MTHYTHALACMHHIKRSIFNLPKEMPLKLFHPEKDKHLIKLYQCHFFYDAFQE